MCLEYVSINTNLARPYLAIVDAVAWRCFGVKLLKKNICDWIWENVASTHNYKYWI